MFTLRCKIITRVCRIRSSTLLISMNKLADVMANGGQEKLH